MNTSQHQGYAIGVDIGGTKIAFALVNSAGQVKDEHRLPTLPDEGFDAVVGRVAEGVHVLLERTDKPINGIGIGCPGFVDHQQGVVLKTVHLHWTNAPLREALRQKLTPELPIKLENDVNALATGEVTYGAVRGVADMVYLAMGTGLGATVISDNRLIHGSRFAAMEFGHMALIPNGRQCLCGRRGCLDMYLSGTGVKIALKEFRSRFPTSALAQMESPTTHDFMQHLQKGDALAVAVRDDMLHWLDYTISWCVGMVNPSHIVIGGGMGSAILPYLIDDLREGVRGHTLVPDVQMPEILPAHINSTAVGAAALIWHDLMHETQAAPSS